jgi:Zn-finger nucleic acid-binding protein
MIVCPYCEQDYVWEVSIENIPGLFYMCLECDTVWMTTEEINNSTGCIFTNFMRNRGINPDWEDINQIRMA